MMKIGFIGAGRVGVSLGKYFTEKGRKVGGYYSLSPESARWAAEFTSTQHYKSLQEIISSCDMILFTVPDDAIASVWAEAKQYISGRIVGHCSGIYSSKIFSDIGSTDSFAYSIHPLFAISSKEHSWKELDDILFAIEGDTQYLPFIEELFHGMGNRTRIISVENKIKYHAAAAISSNYMTALFFMAQTLFLECGFEEKEAKSELYALARGNLEHIVQEGCAESLTGPLERGDLETIKRHIEALQPEMREVYRSTAGYLLNVAEKKNPGKNYDAIRQLCKES